MKPALSNGRIPPPSSLHAADTRRRQLVHEIAKIERQLDDPSRVLRYPNTGIFFAWRDSARHALKLFNVEMKQLEGWMKENGYADTDAVSLLREAHAALKLLRDEVDFDPDEHVLVERISKYLEKT